MLQTAICFCNVVRGEASARSGLNFELLEVSVGCMFP